MLASQIDQFPQAMWWKLVPILFFTAVGVVLIGVPLYWLRLKLERKLIQKIRSARAAREALKSASVSGISGQTPDVGGRRSAARAELRIPDFGVANAADAAELGGLQVLDVAHAPPRA